MTAAAIATAIAMATPIIDGLIHEKNSKKAARMRQNLNEILASYNLKISDLRRQLEARGIRYNDILEKLNYTSPAGSAFKAKAQEQKDYQDFVDKTNTQINKLQNQSERIAAQLNQDIERKETSGIGTELVKVVGLGG